MDTRQNVEHIKHVEPSRQIAVAVLAVLLATLSVLLAAFAGGCGDNKNETVWTGTVTDYNATSGVEATGTNK